MAKPFRTLSHDRSVMACALLGGLPAVALGLWLLWSAPRPAASTAAAAFAPADGPSLERWGATLVVLGCWLGFAAAARVRVLRPLQTLANLLMALREGDYSFRARREGPGDPLGDVLEEVNALRAVLDSQRRGAIEAAALLRAVMEEIDVAIFAFDERGVLRLANRAGQKLLQRPFETLVGTPASSLGLAEYLEGEPNRVLPATFPGAPGAWGLRRKPFREEGRPHQLVVVSDLSRPLREAELRAWQRLVRVLGHELNNSLAPIKSIAGSLAAGLRRPARPADWEDDLRAGLEVIGTRAESLERFIGAYARLARLPAPALARCELEPLVRRAAALEKRLPVAVRGGPALMLQADGPQIEQMLINLMKNAVEAALEQRAAGAESAGTLVSWRMSGAFCEVRIEDDGPGIAQASNLFVPFFTTKPEGSGIGLVLCRQIAENHGGTLELRNREHARGCAAVVRLPLLRNDS